MTVIIGVNGETKTFQKGEEEKFFDWLLDSNNIRVDQSSLHVERLCGHCGH